MNKNEVQMVMFLLRADAFYVLTRFSASAFLQNATFRMAHHTIEYYFKAGLSPHASLAKLRKYGHDLDKLWDQYHEGVPHVSIDLRIIRHLNSFETMRYPGQSKFVRTDWGLSYKELFSEVFVKHSEEVQETLACFSLPDFDKIVFDIRSSLPFGKDLPMIYATPDHEKYLFKDNSFFCKAE